MSNTTQEQTCTCGNCEAQFDTVAVVPLACIKDLDLRLEIGAEVPAGECPECGALCYLDEKPENVTEHPPKVSKAELLAVLNGLLRHCVTPGGFPDAGKGRTPEAQAAYDAARAVINKLEN